MSFNWIRFGKRVFGQSMEDDVIGLSAELAYRFFLALFPFVIFLTALGGFLASTLPVENPAQSIVSTVGALLPQQARALVEGELQRVIQNRNPTLTSISVVLALIFATGGMNAIIKSMNRVYDVSEWRPIWKRYPTAVVLTIVASAAMITAFVLFGPVRLLAPEIASALGIPDATGLLVTVVAFIGAFVLVVVAAVLIYRIAPNIRLPFRALWPGAILFAIGWLITAFAFNFYVTNFGNYANTYGALAGVALMLLWFYASALVFLICGQVNAVLHTMTAPGDLERRRVESADQDSRQEGEQPD